MATWWQKTLAAAAGLAGGAYFLLIYRPLPKTKGTLHLQGTHKPIEIITDRYGVPHIYAQNEDDLYFAQGFFHAQERLWQMELNWRIASGRLSEIFGEIALETDRFTRRLGMHRAATADVERLPEHSKSVLEAYMPEASMLSSNAAETISHSNSEFFVSSQITGKSPTASNGPR